MPSPRHYFRRKQTFQSNREAPEVFRLWLLRLLVPLGAHREFLKPHGFNSDDLAVVLGLGHWIDGEVDDWSNDASAIDADEPSDETASSTPHRYEIRCLRTELRRLHRAAERRTVIGTLPPALRSNLDRLAALVGLSAVDVCILEFAVMIHSDGLLVETAEWLGQLSTVKLIHTLAVVLALPEEQVREALAAKGVLTRSGLVTCLRNGADTLSSKLDLLVDFGRRPRQKHQLFCQPENRCRPANCHPF